MIENFFQSLSSGGVEYLLISGQATVLYGAATFSEDIDLWVNPTTENGERFLAALRSCGARYYKLTPPWEVGWLARGHGFHFVLPDADGPPVYLDVMGVPPRVPSFAGAVKAAPWMETDWGSVHVVGIRELVELKKTQRLEDYPIIGRLALAGLEQPKRALTDEDYRWALEQVFTLPELRMLLEKHPAVAGALPETAPGCLREYAAQSSGGAAEQIESEVALYLQGRIARLQEEDRRHWRGIIRELKQMREQDRLMPEGAPV